MENEDGEIEEIGTTEEHPIWVKAQGWVFAGKLLPGDEIFTSNGGWLRVNTGTWLSDRQTVYIFEVNEFHTYFVGNYRAWVHNNPCAQSSPSNKKAIVYGEGMDAVKGAVRILRKQGVNAKWYSPWKKNFELENFDIEKSLTRNERQINTKMKEGYEIYDIGIDPARNRRSLFYEREKRQMKKNNYPTIPMARP